MNLRPSNERGSAFHGWLDTKHTFSFAGYYDPEHMGFRALRVINEDKVSPGAGFGTHGHRDMEIISYVLDGALEHEDSMGHVSVLRPGDVQRVSAGTGILHSEYNASKTDPVHFLQIWLLPNRQGVTPGYEQESFDVASTPNQWRLLVSPDGADGSLTIHQDARLYVAKITEGEALSFQRPAGRHVWLHVARGALEIDGQRMTAGDGASTSDAPELELTATEDAEVLLFDLA